MTERLDRAIKEAYRNIDGEHDECADMNIERQYARALIADLLEGMEDNDDDSMSIGWNGCLRTIRDRAGIGGE